MDKKRGGGRKAQLSLFMILAVVILISGVVWYVFLDAAEQEVQRVPQEIDPLNTFITDCLRQSADLAMRQIGSTGGYASLPPSIGGNPAAYLQIGPFSAQRMPYWWHEGVSSAPPIDFIAKEAERQSEINLIACLDNFSDFSSLYDVTQKSLPVVEIIFAEEETLVKAHYPLEASTKRNASLFSLGDFEESLPIRFLKVYTLATTLMERE